MHGRMFPLKAKVDGGRVCRVVDQEFVQLPARFEMNVPGRIVYWDLSSTWETWVSKPSSPIGETRVACAMVPNRNKNVLVWAMNLASYSVALA